MALNHSQRGCASGAPGTHPKAAEAYKTYLKRVPSDVDALNNLAAALLIMHRPEEALVQIQRALKVKPEYVSANTNLGYAFAELGRRDEALKPFRPTIALKLGTTPAWNGLAEG